MTPECIHATIWGTILFDDKHTYIKHILFTHGRFYDSDIHYQRFYEENQNSQSFDRRFSSCFKNLIEIFDIGPISQRGGL